jgi:predicted  nucleic acid-binding Zn-ribbon protein
MPTREDEVDDIARAAAEFENAAVALHGERLTLARAEEDLEERTESLERQRQEHEEAEAAARDAERLQEALEEEFRTLEEALQQDVQQVLERIRQAERELRNAQARYGEHDRNARREHDNVTAADRDVSNERQASPTRSATCRSRPGSLASSPAPTCARSSASPWPHPGRKAAPGQPAKRRATPWPRA